MSSSSNILTIAQKEFADNVHSPKMRLLIVTLILILLSESVLEREYGRYLFKGDISPILQIFGLFFPILGLALGFDSIVKERNSDSLNTLLTHPVFRDNIIAGKIAGALITLFTVLLVSLAISQGLMMVLSGVRIEATELSRMIVFALVSLIYLSSFVALGLLLSTFSANPSGSFMYGIVIWAVFVITFGGTTAAIASVVSGGSAFGLGEDEYADERASVIYENMRCLSLTNHYSMVISGVNGMSQLNIASSSDDSASSGIFDTGHSLMQWVTDYWTNITALIITPFLLFIASFVIFIKKDMTR